MTPKKQATIGAFIGFIIITGLFFGFGSYFKTPPFGVEVTEIKDELKLKAPKEKIIKSKEVDWIEEVKDEEGKPTGETINHGKITKYDYISDVEVATSTMTVKDGKREKVITEKVERRTGNAKFFENGEETIGHFYSGTPFVKQDNKWYHSETATTSIDAYEEQTKPDLISRIKNLFIAQATELTPVYSAAGDGWVGQQQHSWDDCHDNTIGRDDVNWYDATVTTSLNGRVAYYSNNGYVIARAFHPIDTSGLGSGASVSAATLNLYVQSKADDYNDGKDYLVVVKTFQASNTTLARADYEDCGYDSGTETGGRAKYTPVEGSDQLDITSIATSAYKAWTLNAIGRGWINLTGYTNLGMREGHDVEDSVIGASNENNSYINTRTSEYANTASDPYLSVTYTAAAADDSGSQPVIWFD